MPRALRAMQDKYRGDIAGSYQMLQCYLQVVVLLVIIFAIKRSIIMIVLKLVCFCCVGYDVLL